MSEYDGEIRIKTVVDSSEIEKDIMNQKKSYEELAKEQDYLLKNQIKLEKEKSKLISKQTILNERLIALSNREQKIRDKIEFTKKQSEFGNLPGGFFSPKEEMKLKHYQLDLNEVISKESRLKKEIESVNSAIDSNITNLNKTSEMLKLNASIMESIEKSIEEISKIKTEIEEIQKGIEESQKGIEESQKGIEEAEKNIEEAKKGFSEIAKAQRESKSAMKEVNESLENIKTESTDGKIKKLKRRFEELTESFINFANKAKEIKNFDGFSKPLANNIKSINNSFERFSNRIFNLAKTAFIFNIIRSGFNELSKGLRALIRSDDVLSNSLNQIRANLLTAFAPIYQAVLPALRELGKFLSWASLQLATFTSALFGKTLSQSQQSAYEMSNAINESTKSLKKQSKGLKSVSKEAEKASNSLASFDRIEVLADEPKKDEKQKDELPQIVPPSIDKNSFNEVDSEISSFWEKIANRIKEPFKNLDLSRLTGAFEKLKQTLSKFGKSTVEGLWWIYENVLAPLATWTISEVLPRFFDVFSASLEAIQPIAKQAGEDLKNLYDIFLKPIAEWTGSKVIEFLEGFSDALNRIAEFFGEGNNKVYLEWLVSFLEGLAATFVLSGIKKLATLILFNLVPAIWAMTTAFFSNPWTWVVAGIGLVIGAIIMAIRHWDDIKKFFENLWEGFKKVIDDMKSKISEFGKKVGEWIESIKSAISNKWNEIWEGASIGVKEFGNKVIRVLNSITYGIRKVLNFVVDGINSLTDKINGFGFKIPDWLGGFEFKMNVPKIPRVSESFLKIPELAQGAVLDGSNPFLAWVNDQPKGQTNIETPLNTMVEAFNTALKGNSTANNVIIQASGDVSQLISYLHFELKKENSMIGDNMITGDVYV